jgi:hypothetical protein
MKQAIITLLVIITLAAYGQKDIPELNQKIVDYVSTTIGTQVNRGECWDLAYEALNRHNAEWDHKFKYGREINPKKEVVLPGDLIQFSKVVLKYSKGNAHYTETMGQHTAIVYRVVDQENKIFELAHQNTDFSGRKVGLSEFNLSHVAKGKLWFYRPVQRK